MTQDVRAAVDDHRPPGGARWLFLFVPAATLGVVQQLSAATESQWIVLSAVLMVVALVALNLAHQRRLRKELAVVRARRDLARRVAERTDGDRWAMLVTAIRVGVDPELESLERAVERASFEADGAALRSLAARIGELSTELSSLLRSVEFDTPAPAARTRGMRASYLSSAAVLILYSVAGLAGAGVLLVAAGADVQPSEVMSLALVPVAVALVSWAVAAATGLFAANRRLAATIRALEAQELRALALSVARDRWIRREVAVSLHGPVVGRIAACAMAVGFCADEETADAARRDALMQSVSGHLAAASRDLAAISAGGGPAVGGRLRSPGSQVWAVAQP